MVQHLILLWEIFPGLVLLMFGVAAMVMLFKYCVTRQEDIGTEEIQNANLVKLQLATNV